MKNILFVCTGNTCRSPMAEAILRAKLLPEVSVRSAGLFADGGKLSDNAKSVLTNNNIDFKHRSKQLCADDLLWADLILTMTAMQKGEILKIFKNFADKVVTLKSYCGYKDSDVLDPFGGSKTDYESTYLELNQLINILERKLKMKIAIASDHGGIKLKQEIIMLLKEMNMEFTDFGCFTEESVDYPEYANVVSENVASGEFERGILICGTGIGMSIAANKVPGIRCALVHDVYSAKLTRQHNNSNILAMGERVIGVGLAKEIVTTWINARFEGGRHQKRIDKLELKK